MELIQNPYHNCYTINIYSVLKRFGLDNDMFWNQAGLSYSSDSTSFRLTAFYKDIRNELENSGVKLITQQFKVTDDCISKIKEVLRKSTAITLEIDCYELPYCIAYQDTHEPHWIEVTLINDELYIFDHYYRYQGNIPLDVIIKGLNSLKENCRITQNTFYEFKKINDNVRSRNQKQWAEDRIKENVEQMAVKNNTSSEGNNTTIYVGMNVFPTLEKDLLSLTRALKNEVSDELKQKLDYYYSMIKDVASSRYNYGLFLNKLNYTDAVDLFNQSYQNWIALANYILKAFVTNNFNKLEDQIKARMQRIVMTEKDICDYWTSKEFSEVEYAEST